LSVAAARGKRERLDAWLVAHGHAPSRERAQALVMAGRVRIDGAPATKPGHAVPAAARVEVEADAPWVSRGAFKLLGALDAFAIDPAGLVALDVGASTGGFTEVLLARGAVRVHAVDVGRAQLHERLRTDPRVIVREGVNARLLAAEDVPEPVALVVMDVSFISVRLILPALRAALVPGARLAVLVKPQFEVGKAEVGRGGVVREPALWRRCLAEVAGAACELGYAVTGACASPIAGGEGNREFFLALRWPASGEPGALAGDALEAALDAAVAAAPEVRS
jgi:23S rRNA (cytidine1920-2'-O)/16S rRNA (cytidine1409-2'-O)-methyltransferase